MSLSYLVYIAGVVALLVALASFLGAIHTVGWVPALVLGIILLVVASLMGRDNTRI